eukprot:GHRQ01023260.1.p1 GENE.GHRQ01023260.1~~GHRQ01023260.1.p1  ORF type:complete len:152 (+),score=13.47 GHRQ01023260.1:1079-1534(+)
MTCQLACSAVACELKKEARERSPATNHTYLQCMLHVTDTADDIIVTYAAKYKAKWVFGLEACGRSPVMASTWSLYSCLQDSSRKNSAWRSVSYSFCATDIACKAKGNQAQQQHGFILLLCDRHRLQGTRKTAKLQHGMGAPSRTAHSLEAN